MSLLDRTLPLLTWLPRARAARFLPSDYFARLAATREAYRRARHLDLPVTTELPETTPVGALQFQLGRRRNIRWLPLPDAPFEIPLREGEVLFVPQSLGTNKYITGYSDAYLLLDIEHFVDPQGTQNTRSFKTAPAWGRCRVARSRHPNFREGATYYGFWPVAAYCVRAVERVDADGFVGYQQLPGFTGPREWLKLIRLEDPADQFAIDTLEYVKIALTFAREVGGAGFFGAGRLVLSSASSASGQLLALFMKQEYPDFPVVGLTSARNQAFVRSLPYFDTVATYDAIPSLPNDGKSLYFDVLGRASVTDAVFDHFRLRRWWIYGEGSLGTYWKFMRRNPRGTFYTNLVDSYDYQLRHGITDRELVAATRAAVDRYDLEKRWYGDVRIIKTGQELFDLYHAYLENTHTGERVVYRSPWYGHPAFG